MTKKPEIKHDSENCPKCKVGSPFRLATGRLVCSKCGWTDRPKVENHFRTQSSQEKISWQNDVIYSMRGVGALLEVFENKVTITPKGVFGFMDRGFKGAKTIPFDSISSIQFKEAGDYLSGYFQFVIPGENKKKGGVLAVAVANDENAFMFAEVKNNELATQIKAFIEEKAEISQEEISLQKNTVYSMQGVGDLLEVFENKVTITPKGVLGFMSKGLKGTKTIPFSSISAIQFKEAGDFLSGYLQFTIPGGNESKGGVFAAATDENTFMFSDIENNELATQIKDFIEAKVQELRIPKVSQQQSNISLADELQKLASLRDNGILSDQEFQSAKIRIITG